MRHVDNIIHNEATRSRDILDARITADHRCRPGDMKTTDFLGASFLCTNTA